MGRALLRLGGLLMVAAVVYLVAAQVLAEPDNKLFRYIAFAGVVCVLAGLIMSVAGRGMAAIVGGSCPRCGRRVARGRVYCDDHLQETINEYKDRQRDRGR